jgi:alpha-glucosidase
MRYQLYAFVFLFLLSPPLLGQEVARILSPDKALSAVFHLKDAAEQKGILTYQVIYQGQVIVEESRLGIADQEAGFTVGEISEKGVDTVWFPPYGERSRVRDHYREATIRLNPEKRQQLEVLVRVYNEGVAFRYVYPEHPQGSPYVSIRKETTEFTLPKGTKAYFTPRAQSTYQLLPLSDWPGEAERPLTLHLPNGLYACLAEAEMVDYSRTKFTLSPQKPNAITCTQYDAVDQIPPFKTPWRVIMVAATAGRLLENNDLLLNLNPPCALPDPSWIRPGKVIREVTLSTAGAKKLVDFALEQNLQYIHFDAGWYGYEYVSSSDATTVTVDPKRNPKGDLDLPEAIRYAKSNGIGVIVYVNQRALYQQLDTLLPLYKSWGIDGVKFGFVQVGSHRWTTWMHEAVRKAAEHGLVVNIHDEYRPTGFSRTYPNLLTQEGIYGNEEMPDATHNTILPFTRFIAGAADYTFCFNEPRVKNTKAHQLALPVLYYSPLQYLYWYGKPEHYPDRQEIEFWKHVPTVWDDTRVLAGLPGEHVTIARRKGEEWYVGAITNTESRFTTLNLDFLEKGQRYTAWIYEDTGDGKVSKKVVKVKQGARIPLRLLASGGAAIRIFKG